MALPLFEEEAKAKESLSNTLHNLAALNPEMLIRTQELGIEMDFREGEAIFNRTLQLFRDLQQVRLDGIPLETINALRTRADITSASFKQILDFKVKATQNPAQARESLIRSISNEYHSHFNVIAPIIAYSIRKGI